MSTLGVFAGDPGTLAAAAAGLREIASTVEETKVAFDASCRAVGSAWNGELDAGFARASESRAAALSSAAQNLRRAADALATAASTIDSLRGEAYVVARELESVPTGFEPATVLRRGQLQIRLSELTARVTQARTRAASILREVADAASLTRAEDFSASFAGQALVFGEEWMHTNIEFTRGVLDWAVATAKGLGAFVYLSASIGSGTILFDRQAQGMLRDLAHGATDLASDMFTDPLGTGARLLELDLLRENPARWLGRVAPDLILTAATAGAALGPKVGTTAAKIGTATGKTGTTAAKSGRKAAVPRSSGTSRAVPKPKPVPKPKSATKPKTVPKPKDEPKRTGAARDGKTGGTRSTTPKPTRTGTIASPPEFAAAIPWEDIDTLEGITEWVDRLLEWPYSDQAEDE